MAKTLSEFSIDDQGDDYLVTIKTEDGEAIELRASFAQLDLMVEAIGQQLDADEESELEVEGATEA